MFIYKINQKLIDNGFYKIPKQCLNAEFYRFEEMLKADDKKLIKSALVNWFYNKYKLDFVVALNGTDCIYLSTDYKTDELYFINYTVYNGYLIHHKNYQEYLNCKLMVDRVLKIDKVLNHG